VDCSYWFQWACTKQQVVHDNIWFDQITKPKKKKKQTKNKKQNKTKKKQKTPHIWFDQCSLAPSKLYEDYLHLFNYINERVIGSSFKFDGFGYDICIEMENSR
jgi:hypothetical protein